MSDSSPKTLLLCGVLRGWKSSFSIPFFGTNTNPNQWYLMKVSHSGLADERIIRFEETNLIPNQSVPRTSNLQFSVGDSVPRVLETIDDFLIGDLHQLYEQLHQTDLEKNVDPLARADIFLNYDFPAWAKSISLAARAIAKHNIDSAMASWFSGIFARRLFLASQIHSFDVNVMRTNETSKLFVVNYQKENSFRFLSLLKEEMDSALRTYIDDDMLAVRPEEFIMEVNIPRIQRMAQTKKRSTNARVISNLQKKQAGFMVDGKVPYQFATKKKYDSAVKEYIRHISWTFEVTSTSDL